MSQSTPSSTNNLSALMCELTVALAQLSDRMNTLAFVLERQHLDSSPQAAPARQAAIDVISRARMVQ